MMKKTVLPLLAAVCCAPFVQAQDMIVKRDSARIEARVTEIGAEAVRYKRFTNPDGPTYVLSTADVAYIRYANGETERFESAASIPAQTVSAKTPVGDEYVLRQYKIGDYYERDGIKGVVCQVAEDGLHGTIISLDEIYLPWSTFRKPDLFRAGADDRSDGAANMQTVARYIADNQLSWEDFPAFKWCRDKGEGWYLPAIDELLAIGHNYNGGSRVHNNRQARNRFNAALKEHGGERMDRLVYYFSSTETDEKSAYTSHTDLQPPYVVEIPKYNKFLVRAVRKF